MEVKTGNSQVGILKMKAQQHSETSIQAAVEIEPKAGTLRALVLGYIRECGNRGATDEEIQIALRMNPSTQRPRRVELLEVGLIRDSGTQRKTASNRSAVVWTATRKEKAQLELFK